jgi:hypothetical protein
MLKVFKRFLKRNINDFRKELSRAHLIIALLSISIIVLLSLGAVQPVTFDQPLSAVCVVLLSIVTLISLCMTYTLSTKKKR